MSGDVHVRICERPGVQFPRATRLVMFCETRKDAEKSKRILDRMLAKRGLELSSEKIRIVHITEGFDSLGFNIRQYEKPNSSKRGWKLLITPSKESVKKVKAKLKEEWMKLKTAPTGAVIKRLNPIIKGWGNYFRIGVSREVFSELDNYLFQRQERFVNYRHPNKSTDWKAKKYWGKIATKGKWIFMDKKTGAYLHKFSWIPIQRHVMVVKDSSPDDPTLKTYWENRRRKKKNLLVSKRMKQRLVNIQKGICPICNQPLISLDETGQEELHVHHVKTRKSGGTNQLSNLRLIHLYCHQQVHS